MTTQTIRTDQVATEIIDTYEIHSGDILWRPNQTALGIILQNLSKMDLSQEELFNLGEHLIHVYHEK